MAEASLSPTTVRLTKEHVESLRRSAEILIAVKDLISETNCHDEALGLILGYLADDLHVVLDEVRS